MQNVPAFAEESPVALHDNGCCERSNGNGKQHEEVAVEEQLVACVFVGGVPKDIVCQTKDYRKERKYGCAALINDGFFFRIKPK